jgi:hypothetical protein
VSTFGTEMPPMPDDAELERLLATELDALTAEPGDALRRRRHVAMAAAAARQNTRAPRSVLRHARQHPVAAAVMGSAAASYCRSRPRASCPTRCRLPSPTSRSRWGCGYPCPTTTTTARPTTPAPDPGAPGRSLRTLRPRRARPAGPDPPARRSRPRRPERSRPSRRPRLLHRRCRRCRRYRPRPSRRSRQPRRRRPRHRSRHPRRSCLPSEVCPIPPPRLPLSRHPPSRQTRPKVCRKSTFPRVPRSGADRDRFGAQMDGRDPAVAFTFRVPERPGPGGGT